ncbi:MAG: PLDc N-terminal domain-containing protein [Pseudomonadota bacterium]
MDIQLSVFGIVLLVVLIVDVAVLLRILTSHALLWTKLLWIALVFLLPILGAGLWFFFGPKQPEPDLDA